MSRAPYITIRLSTSAASEAEAGGENSKKERACWGRRMALMPKPRKMAPKTLAARRREGEWEMREVDMLLEGCGCVWVSGLSAVGLCRCLCSLLLLGC